jgi:hypothetical protein
MLNIEKYKHEIIELGTQITYRNAFSIGYHKDIEWCDIVDWLCEEWKEPLLNEKEKEFIRDLKKWYNFDAIKDNYPYLDLLVKKATNGCGLIKYECVHSIPYFEGNPMFEGLENSDKVVHSIEELDL